MDVAIVAAVAENGIIGRGGGLPWRLPTDLKRFKALTLGHTVVMGRRTHQSIGRPLPGRRTVVVTSHALSDVEVAASLPEALERAGRPAFLVGGAALYAEGLRYADTVLLTRVHVRAEGDVRFPTMPEGAFVLARSEAGERGPEDDHEFTFETFVRAGARA